MTWDLTPELQDKILSQLESGISLVKICAQKGMPSRNTVLNWQRNNAEFCAKCVRAREAAGEIAAEKLEEINEKVLKGELEPHAASVISSNLKWTASKLYSKKYGDRTAVDVDGKLEKTVVVRDYRGMWKDKAIENGI